jgi:hypothetical protein
VNEDRKLLQWVRKEGPCKWTTCAEFIKGRSGKQCRERWLNTLNPNVKKGQWEEEEDFLIFKLFNKYGSQWSKISTYFKKRTENSIKNRFYSTLRRIAAERKKERNCEETEKKTKSKLNSLLKFVPEALNEKTLILMGKNNKNSENIVLIDEKTNANTENELEIILPTIRLEDMIENVCQIPFQKNLPNEIYESYEQPIGVLEKDIDNFLDSFFETSSYERNPNLGYFDENMESEENCSFFSSKVNNSNINEVDNVNILVDQLSSMEELLQNTKRQIIASNQN